SRSSTPRRFWAARLASVTRRWSCWLAVAVPLARGTRSSSPADSIEGGSCSPQGLLCCLICLLPCSRRRHHRYADGHRDGRHVTGGGETTGLRIDFEDDHRATVLIGGQEVGSRWIDAEIARGLAPGGLVAGGGQQSRDGVDREDRDAVV